ncbi:MAG: 50S ribosomal protein L18 [Parcubacteria group bacterium]|nr:50S ribosomal protein L18 [Parcubacteria group bacterium]
MKSKTTLRKRRHIRIRAKVHGTATRPRLSVFRSNKHFYAQLINDDASVTLGASSDGKVRGGRESSPKERAKLIGADIAEQAREKGIKEVVFDRGGFAYTGIIKEFAEAARGAGLGF